GDAAVDIGVADLDAVEPRGDLRRVEGVDAAGEAEVDRILELDGFVEVFRVHEAEHRPEDLGEVEERSRLDPVLDARAPPTPGVVELRGFGQAGLSGDRESAVVGR